MNPLAAELNEILMRGNAEVARMLSSKGRQLFFPRGILSQGAEAREKAHQINATIGIAREKGHTMRFDSVMAAICNIRPSASLTYAPSFGIPELRKCWQKGLIEKNPSLAGKTISLPVVTSGITHAISLFAMLWLDPGDAVMLPEMMWGNYNLIFNVCHGAHVHHYPFEFKNGALDMHNIEKHLIRASVQHRKLSLVLNFPHNPTGYTLSVREAEQLKATLFEIAERGTCLVVGLDDAYFGLFYDRHCQRESLFASLCDLHPRILAVKFDGATKENFAWGLRVGFITYGTQMVSDAAPFYAALEKKTAGAVRGSISNASHLSQSIVLQSMRQSGFAAEKQEKFEILAARARRVKEVLQDPKYRDAWEGYPFNSGYFMCIRLKRVNAEALRLYLLQKAGIGLIAIDGQNLRIAFSCLEEDQIQPLFDSILEGVRALGTSGT